MFKRFCFAARVSTVPQEVHEPEPAPQQDAQEDQNCDVWAVWENILPPKSAQEAWKRCPFLLKLNCRYLNCDICSDAMLRCLDDIYEHLMSLNVT